MRCPNCRRLFFHYPLRRVFPCSSCGVHLEIKAIVQPQLVASAFVVLSALLWFGLGLDSPWYWLVALVFYWVGLILGSKLRTTKKP